MNNLDMLIEDYCKNHEVKQIPVGIKTITYKNCFCCNANWNSTFQKIPSSYRSIPVNSIICPKCQHWSHKNWKYKNITKEQAIKYLHDQHLQKINGNNGKNKITDLVESSLGDSVVKLKKDTVKYGIKNLRR